MAGSRFNRPVRTGFQNSARKPPNLTTVIKRAIVGVAISSVEVEAADAMVAGIIFRAVVVVTRHSTATIEIVVVLRCLVGIKYRLVLIRRKQVFCQVHIIYPNSP